MSYSIPTIPSPTSNGRQIAIADIHGCCNTFEALLQKLKLSKNDQIFLLGDLIDKGNCSKGVVDLVMDLKQQGYGIFVLKGNHEQAFLKTYDCGWDFFTAYLDKNNTEAFLGNNLNTYLQFFAELEYAYDLGDWILSHAEFLAGERSLYRGMRGLFSGVNFELKDEALLKKRQVTGHFVKSMTKIKQSIEGKNRVIFLDNGCIYQDAWVLCVLLT
ncbi:MAG: metallophosphoesterase [Chitinophagales bacterium]